MTRAGPRKEASPRTQAGDEVYPRNPAFGASPFIGPVIDGRDEEEVIVPDEPDRAGDVEDADALAELVLVLEPMAEPGKGAIEGVEKLPNPLVTPVILGSL